MDSATPNPSRSAFGRSAGVRPFGLARVAPEPGATDRLARLPLLLQQADARLSLNAFDAWATLAVGAAAEELGFPAIAERYVNMAFALAAHSGESRLAEAAGAPVAELAGPHVTDHHSRGFMLFLAERFDEARRAFALALADAPEDAAAALHLARTQIALREPDADVARTLAPHADRHSPRRNEVRKELAATLFRLESPRADAYAASGVREETAGVAALSSELAEAMAEGRRERPIARDPYRDLAFLASQWTLASFALRFRKAHDEALTFFHALMHHRVRQMLREHPGILTVIDFGVLCGHTIDALAQTYPSVTFIGVDRSAEVLELNQTHFRRPNLRFEAANITKFLGRNTFAHEVLLVHVRTAAYLYPPALVQLYAQCARRGIEHVLAVEEFGISRETGRFTRFAGDAPRSVAYRVPQFCHDYMGYLGDAGYAAALRLVPLANLWKAPGLIDAHAQVVHAELRRFPAGRRSAGTHALTRP